MDINELDFTNTGAWPMPVKLVACLLLSIAIVVFAWLFMIKDMNGEIESLEGREVQLRGEFEFEQQRALNLEPLKQQLAQMEQVLQQLTRQLPSKTEMPDLIIDVSQAALASGLNNQLFRPGGEVKRDFFAEQPIALRFVGTYHQYGDFVSTVAQLPRVVILTMHDMGLRRIPGTGNLEMSGSVKTYRYLDDSE